MSHKTLLRTLEYSPFLAKSDWLAWRTVAVNYIIIAIAFILPALWFNVLTVVVSIILLGNRQLGLGVLMHDCVHGAMFKSPFLNKWVGEIMCSAAILGQFEGYRKYHLKHHARAGTTNDPDYPNYKIYPVEKMSFMRKVARDMLGITGLKNLYIVVLMHAGLIEYDMSYQTHKASSKLSVLNSVKCLIRNLWLGVLFQLALVGVLAYFEQLGLYLLWWIAYLTTFALFSRIRNAAEHANVPDLLNADPRLHARTVYTNWLARLTVAPNTVNYHLEHHWMPAIPPYRLPAFHQYLLSEGVLQDTPILKSYSEVIRTLVKPSPTT